MKRYTEDNGGRGWGGKKPKLIEITVTFLKYFTNALHPERAVNDGYLLPSFPKL